MNQPRATVAAEITAASARPTEEEIQALPRPLLVARFHKRLAAQSQTFNLEVEFPAAPGFTILFGPSGAGKTTLLDCVAGLTTPDSGRIAIGGRVLFDFCPRLHIFLAQRPRR